MHYLNLLQTLAGRRIACLWVVKTDHPFLLEFRPVVGSYQIQPPYKKKVQNKKIYTSKKIR